MIYNCMNKRSFMLLNIMNEGYDFPIKNVIMRVITSEAKQIQIQTSKYYASCLLVNIYKDTTNLNIMYSGRDAIAEGRG